MLWSKWDKRIARAALALGFFALSPCAEELASGAPINPESSVLPHGAYTLGGQLGFHRTGAPGETQHQHFPFASRMDFGLFGRGEFGLELGEGLAVAAKVRLLQEDGPWPEWSLGARSLFHSSEAHLMTASEEESGSNEVYMALSHHLPASAKISAGVSIPGSEQDASPFWGLEKNLGAGLGVLYEGYWRVGSHHHNAGLRWRFRDVFQINMGATEVWRWFYQDGSFGFLSENPNGSRTAYRAPGLYLNFTMVGHLTHNTNLTNESRIEALEKEREKQLRHQEELLTRIDRLELQVDALRGDSPDSIAIVEHRTDSLLTLFVTDMQSDAWDPKHGKTIAEAILAQGSPAHRWLVRTAQRPVNALNFRLGSIRVLSLARNEAFLPIFSQLLDDADEAVRKEALFAISKIPGKAADALLQNTARAGAPELRDNAADLVKERKKPGSSANKPEANKAESAKAEAIKSETVPESAKADTSATNSAKPMPSGKEAEKIDSLNTH